MSNTRKNGEYDGGMPSIPPVIREMENTLGPNVRKAYLLAARVHTGEKRKSSEAYITHPVAVAKILFDAGADSDVICAALLHDTLEREDAQDIGNEIDATFGDQVLYLVEGVSKNNSITDKQEQQELYIDQIRHTLETDIFAFFIKMADLIHNMSTIDSLPAERRAQWILELRSQYFPLFSEYFHKIPLSYRDVFRKMMDSMEETVAFHEQHSRKAPRR